MDNLIKWLEMELAEAEGLQYDFNERGRETEYSDYEEEIERHEQDGWVYALQYVLRNAKEMQ